MAPSYGTTWANRAQPLTDRPRAPAAAMARSRSSTCRPGGHGLPTPDVASRFGSCPTRGASFRTVPNFVMTRFPTQPTASGSTGSAPPRPACRGRGGRCTGSRRVLSGLELMGRGDPQAAREGDDTDPQGQGQDLGPGHVREDSLDQGRDRRRDRRGPHRGFDGGDGQRLGHERGASPAETASVGSRPRRASRSRSRFRPRDSRLSTVPTGQPSCARRPRGSGRRGRRARPPRGTARGAGRAPRRAPRAAPGARLIGRIRPGRFRPDPLPSPAARRAAAARPWRRRAG